MKKTKKHSRFRVARNILIFWCLFIGVGALFGGACMLIEPSGKSVGFDALLPYFKMLPFSEILFKNFIFPGISLLIVNCFTNLIAAVLLFKGKKLDVILGGVFGFTLMLWIIIQFIIFPTNLLSTLYFIFGIIQLITGYAAWVFYTQEHFILNESDYTNIGANSKKAVVYFSRLGYTKKLAYNAANENGAVLIEVKSPENTDGTLGFWWCGRFGMQNLEMPICELNADLESYDEVTIVAPIWVFKIAAPIKALCSKYSEKLKNVRYIINHFSGFKYFYVFDKLDELLKCKLLSAKSVCTKFGKTIWQKEQ